MGDGRRVHHYLVEDGAAVQVEQAQGTVGAGPRVRHILDVGRGLSLSAACVHGIGVSQSQGSDTLSPDRVQTAWLGVGRLR